MTTQTGREDGCRAAVFNHLLYWIAKKASEATTEEVHAGEACWWATEEQITQGLADTWSAKKVRGEITKLVELGVIGRRHNAVKGWDRTWRYYLSSAEGAVIKDLCIHYGVCLSHLGLPPRVVMLLEAVGAIGTYSLSNCQICRMQLVDLPDATGKSTRAIPKVSTKIFTKGEGIVPPTDDAKVPSPPPAPATPKGTPPRSYSQRTAKPEGTLPLPALPAPDGITVDPRYVVPPIPSPLPPSEPEIAPEELARRKRIGQIAEALKERAPGLELSLPVLEWMEQWDRDTVNGEHGPLSVTKWEASAAKELSGWDPEDIRLLVSELRRSGKSIKLELLVSNKHLLADLRKGRTPNSAPPAAVAERKRVNVVKAPDWWTSRDAARPSGRKEVQA